MPLIFEDPPGDLEEITTAAEKNGFGKGAPGDEILKFSGCLFFFKWVLFVKTGSQILFF